MLLKYMEAYQNIEPIDFPNLPHQLRCRELNDQKKIMHTEMLSCDEITWLYFMTKFISNVRIEDEGIYTLMGSIIFCNTI